MFGLDFPMPRRQPDFFLEEGKPVEIGELRFEVLDCPGHCPGSVSLLERREGIVFTGDVLFAGTVGRTDLPGGDMERLLRSIREKLLSLDDEVRVFAGHGPETTIGTERKQNPFLSGRRRL
jgi:glyoxylase-like metal-dependent hydrolase (beta-lactamase superfamily II)